LLKMVCKYFFCSMVIALTSVMKVAGSIPTWNSENLFSFPHHCQETIISSLAGYLSTPNGHICLSASIKGLTQPTQLLAAGKCKAVCLVSGSRRSGDILWSKCPALVIFTPLMCRKEQCISLTHHNGGTGSYLIS